MTRAKVWKMRESWMYCPFFILNDRGKDPSKPAAPIVRFCPKIFLAFSRDLYYTRIHMYAGVLELVDEADSKTSSPSVAGVGKSLGKSSVFWILFFICLSHPSCVSLQIPGDACLGVKKYICRCVGIGRRGGLKIRWANNSCGFDPRHRHQICSEVLCFGAFFYCSEAKY